MTKVDQDHPMDSDLNLECGTNSDVDGDCVWHSDEMDDNDEGPGDCYYSNSTHQVEYTDVSDYEDSATGSENEFPASASLVCMTFYSCLNNKTPTILSRRTNTSHLLLHIQASGCMPNPLQRKQNSQSVHAPSLPPPVTCRYHLPLPFYPCQLKWRMLKAWHLRWTL